MNSFNSKLHLKDTESVIKNKLTDLLAELKGFKFVTTLALEFRKTGSDDKIKYDTFFPTQKQKQLLMKVTFMM